MNASDLLRNRVAAIAAGTRDLRAATASLDWTRPIATGTSPLGLTFWHLPRTFDWLVNTCIRDAAEVADGPAYGDLPDPDRFGFGTALSADDVATVAAGVDRDRDQLETYADAVHAQVDEFLASLSDDDLDRVVDEFAERQQRRPSYSTPGALAEVAHLNALPLGVLFARPGLSHQMMHLGELDLLKQLA